MNIKLGMERGSVGLLEVLVTMVVVSIGLLALASLQGTFLSESGVSKARAEAKVMAEGKIEEFKNVSTISDFNLFASGADAAVEGKNAIFTRIWTISDETDPERKTITVDVTWDDEAITLTSELAWSAVGSSSVYSGTGGGTGIATSLPSPGSDAAIVEALDEVPDSAETDGFGFKIYRNAEGQQIVADENYDNGTGRQLRCKHVCLTTTGVIYLEGIDDFSTYRLSEK